MSLIFALLMDHVIKQTVFQRIKDAVGFAGKNAMEDVHVSYKLYDYATY